MSAWMKELIFVLMMVGMLIVFPVVLTAILARFGAQTTARKIEIRADKKAISNRFR